MIDIHKGEEDDGYNVEINITSDKLLEAVDLLNFLSFTNYYAEAISGSIMSGGASNSNLNVSGSVAVLYFNNVINALIGDHAVINITGSDPAVEANEKENIEADEGDGITVAAIDEVNVRAIAGALSVAPSKAGVGVTVAYLQNHDTVKAAVGNNAEITSAGFYKQNASVDTDIQLFTAAASLSNSSTSTLTAGGALNAIASDNEAYAQVGDNAHITAGKDLVIGSKTDMI